jgi:hypothetical protein
MTGPLSQTARAAKKFSTPKRRLEKNGTIENQALSAQEALNKCSDLTSFFS